MNFTGPSALLVARMVHDIEEAVAFPAECDRLADRAGIEFLRMGRANPGLRSDSWGSSWRRYARRASSQP